MGSCKALLLLASLAACETSGIEIEVLPPADGAPPPHKIRLFIGAAPATAASIAPEAFGALARRDGYAWIRDAENQNDLQTDLSPGDSVTFGFVAASDATEFGAVIAVGYTNDIPTSAGALFNTKTGVGTVQTFKLQLHSTVDPRVAANRTKALQLEVWGDSAGAETCVHLYRHREPPEVAEKYDSVFIVSKGDTDCDGYADDDPVLECAPLIHDGSVPPLPRDLACATTANRDGALHCVLGGTPCTDGGAPNATTCGPSRFCAPQSVCDLCQMLSGPAALACINDPTGSPNAVPTMAQVKCNIPARRSMQTDPVTLCGDSLIVTTPLTGMTTASRCSNPMVSIGGRPLADRLQIDQLRVEVAVSQSCNLTVKLSGELPAAYEPTLGGFVTVDLDNGRSIALPLSLRIMTPPETCSLTGDCALFASPDDLPRDCILAAPPPV